MANLTGNPWAIFPADCIISVATSITLNADGTVSVTTAAAHGILAPAAITNITQAGSIVTVTSTLNPPVGSLVGIIGVNPAAGASGYNGLWPVLTTSGANFTYFNPTPSAAYVSGGTAVPANAWITIYNASVVGYQGFYYVLSVPSTTTLVLVPQFPIQLGLAAGATGNLAKVLYKDEVRMEDISWQNAAAAGHVLDLRDRDGNPLWQAISTLAGSQNRGKVFWVEGLTPVVIQSGVVLATID